LNIIANISSIATIILFIFYFVGRIIIILKEIKLVCEKIELFITNDDEIFNKYKIVDDISLDDDCIEYMIITPCDKSYNWIKVFKYDDTELKKKTCKYYRKDILNKGHSIKINANIAETIPKYLVQFERSDYIVGEMIIAHNGKNGIQEEMIKCNHTIKSILYYILK